MILFKDKFNKSSQPSAVGIDLFQSGSTVLPPQNDLADMVLDLNRDRYQIYHDEKFKLELPISREPEIWLHFSSLRTMIFSTIVSSMWTVLSSFLRPSLIMMRPAVQWVIPFGCCSFLFGLMAAKWPPLRLPAACPGLLLTSILMLNCA